MRWPWKLPKVPDVDLSESKAALRQANSREQLTARIVRQTTEERIRNHMAQDIHHALGGR